MVCLGLLFGGVPLNSWEDDKLDLEHGIKTFSAYHEQNSLVVLEEWYDGNWCVVCVLKVSLIWSVPLTCTMFGRCRTPFTSGDWIQPRTSWYPITVN